MFQSNLRKELKDSLHTFDGLCYHKQLQDPQQEQLLLPSCPYMVKEHSLIVHVCTLLQPSGSRYYNPVSMEISSRNVVCTIVLCYVYISQSGLHESSYPQSWVWN